MLRFIAKRIGLSLVTLFIVSMIVFIMMSIMPGDLAKKSRLLEEMQPLRPTRFGIKKKV